MADATDTDTLDAAQATTRLKTLIAERHGYPQGREWAVFFELRSNTGFTRKPRYVDVFALNLWPSKKHWRVAYEIKVSRADFLRELAQPDKRAWATEIAHEYWFVCLPGVASEAEIPEGCGLMLADAGLTKLRRVVAARQGSPRPFNDSEVAALLVAAGGTHNVNRLLFRYNGMTLGEAQLKELVEQHIDITMRERLAAEVDNRVRLRLEEAAALLTRYAEQLEQAGLPAPQWMKNFGGECLRRMDWDARSWVQRCVHPGPNARELEAALQQLRSVQQSLDNVRNAAAVAEHQLTAMLNRKTSAADPASAGCDMVGAQRAA